MVKGKKGGKELRIRGGKGLIIVTAQKKGQTSFSGKAVGKGERFYKGRCDSPLLGGGLKQRFREEVSPRKAKTICRGEGTSLEEVYNPAIRKDVLYNSWKQGFTFCT